MRHLSFEICRQVDDVNRYRVRSDSCIGHQSWSVESIPPKGHFFGQIPHPIHNLSEIKAILDSGVTSIQSFPVLTTGQDFLHSCRHFYNMQKFHFRICAQPEFAARIFIPSVCTVVGQLPVSKIDDSTL